LHQLTRMPPPRRSRGAGQQAVGYWNDIADGWRHDRDHVWRAHSDAVNVALCRRWLPRTPDGRLLKTDLFDEATGVGLLGALGDHARRVEGIDRSLSVAGRARARQGRLCVTVTDVRDLPFAAHSFDTVVSNSTLDHFPNAGDIARSLSELRRVMVDGGRLVITLDNAWHPLVALRNALPVTWLIRLGLVPYYVGRTLGPRAASELLEQLGFRVLAVTAVLHCPRVAMVPLARLAGRRGGASARARLFLRLTWMFEHAERLPTRLYTGHFVALLAVKT